ncbi:MAG: 2,5-diketo-D-gluconic acid reductase, partial [Planctomycetota bacterium]
AVFDFELLPDQMAAITGLDRHQRFNDPGVFCEQAFNTFFPIYE